MLASMMLFTDDASMQIERLAVSAQVHRPTVACFVYRRLVSETRHNKCSQEIVDQCLRRARWTNPAVIFRVSAPALAVPDLAPLVHLSPTAMHLALLPPAAWSQINRQIRLCLYSLHDVYTTIALVDFFVSPTLCTGHRKLCALRIFSRG